MMSEQGWITLESKITHQWRTLQLKTNDVELPDGTRLQYSYIEHPGSVVIVPFFPDGNVIVTEQYRYPIRKNSIEFPAGAIEADNQAQEAAQREMMEEIGYKADKFVCLGSFYASNSGSNEKATVFLATGLAPVKGNINRDEPQEIFYRKIPFPQLIDNIKNHIVTDGFTIIAAFFAQEYLKKNETICE